ncbi:MAG TPA: glycosyltransferase family 39 protein [Acidimicrobiia bacterium]|nr:glycosyltransferase family 39 protein [Acidimicrobiia bacterium]
MGRGRFVIALLCIAAAAFVGRAVYILTVTRDQTRSYDELFYKSEATSFVNGDGFEPSYFGVHFLGSGEHPPLTALVLAPAAALIGDNEVAMLMTIALAGSGAVAVIGLLGREVAGPRSGLIAAGIAAVYPNLWINDALLLPETLAALATAAALLFAYRLMRAPGWRYAALLGLSCAVAALSRGELVLLLPMLALPATLLIKDLAWSRRLRLAGVIVLVAAVVVAPWQAFLLSRFEKPSFISYGDGGVVAGANCDSTYSGFLVGFWLGFCRPERLSREPSVAAEQKRNMGREYMRDHLGRLPIVVAARVGRLWSVYRPFQLAKFGVAEGKPRWASLAGWWIFWPLIGLAAAGVIVGRRRGSSLLPLLAPLVIVTLVAALFYGLVRFRVPAEVSIVVLAAAALDAAFVRAMDVRRGKEMPAPA